jgi:enoyl-CoA hydratase/carnithine racemase
VGFLSVVVRTVDAMTTIDDFANDPLDDEAREVIARVVDGGEPELRAAIEQLESMSDNGILQVLAEAAAEVARLRAIQVLCAERLAQR